MKSETGFTPPVEFVDLRSKLYILFGWKKIAKNKERLKRHVEKHVQHQHFLNVLRSTTQTISARIRKFKFINHVLYTLEMTKLCFAAVDDKRYVLKDGVRTLVYGYKPLQTLN